MIRITKILHMQCHLQCIILIPIFARNQDVININDKKSKATILCFLGIETMINITSPKPLRLHERMEFEVPLPWSLLQPI